MKTMNRLILILACGVLLCGCSDSDNHDDPQLPAEQTLRAFEQQFPSARDVVWSKKLGYDVAAFTLAGTRAAASGPNSAWYPEGGTACTYTKLELIWAQLLAEAPAVAQAWEASAYKREGYALDEIGKRSYIDSPSTYKLEIERGEDERDLIYDRAGTLLYDRPDSDADDTDTPCPQVIFDFITANRPGAVIVETDTDHEAGAVYYAVEILLEGNESDLIFDADCNFLYEEAEVDERDYQTALPAAVYEQFLALAADTDTWDEVLVRKDLQGKVLCYVLCVEDERTDTETTYLVDAAGNPIG